MRGKSDIALQGTEKAGYCHLHSCVSFEYDPRKDFQRLKTPEHFDFIALAPEKFVIFFPDDAHMPKVMVGKSPTRMKKIVFKVPVGTEHLS